MSKRKPTSRPPAAKPVAVPVSPRAVWRLLGWGFGGLALIAAGVWATVARVPQRATLEVATLAADAGFVVRQVDIEGAVNQPRLSIYRQVLEGGSDSMLLTDIGEIRNRVKALPWVSDASVSRRWPNRLEIKIVEKRPIAVWQHQGRFSLIDADGGTLPSDRLQDFADLPLLVGREANAEARGLLSLVADEPELMQAMQAAIWVGDRRWDLRMKSGETLSLPEGPAAPKALQRFAAIQRETPLLGRGFVRFDLRIPDKMVVRVSAEAGATAKPRATPKPVPVPKAQATPQAQMPAAAAPIVAGTSLPAAREVVI